MSDLIGNPNCWFSHAQAQFTNGAKKSERLIKLTLMYTLERDILLNYIVITIFEQFSFLTYDSYDKQLMFMYIG